MMALLDVGVWTARWTRDCVDVVLGEPALVQLGDAVQLETLEAGHVAVSARVHQHRGPNNGSLKFVLFNDATGTH